LIISPAYAPGVSDFEQLAQAVELQGRDVVDIGCGDGAFVRALAKAGANVIGIEVSEAAVETARAKDPGNRYLLGGAEAIPLPDQSVDVAVMMRSLHHVPDPDSAFPELRRVVRAFVYIAEPLPTGDFFELMKPVDDETEVRASAQRAIANATGFERVSTTEYDVTIPIATFEAFRDRVLAADPERAERFATLEADLRSRFTPGDYSVPMRADLLRSAGH
jgi:SAM-dependent methyltransferase